LTDELPPGGDLQVTDLGNAAVDGRRIVDPHVHINEPGRTEWEGFDTATKAAIAGGLTSLIEMPLNASPVTTTVKAFEEKIKCSPWKTSCSLWVSGVVLLPGNESEIKPLIEKRCIWLQSFSHTLGY
jgi:allantoinase